MRLKPILVGIWFGTAILLVALLFHLLRITPADVGRMVKTTPAWLLLVVSALTLSNLIAGVARWEAAKAWLSPNSPPVPFWALVEATTWGALLGQIVPPQLSMSAARWAAVRNSSVVGITLYEGLFDLLVLGSGALAGAAILELHMGGTASLGIFALASLVGCLSIRRAMTVGNFLCGHYAATGTAGAALAGRLAVAFERASDAPAATLAVLSGWSFLRLVILSVRAFLIASAFLPHFDGVTILIGYPLVGLIKGLPLFPAGLGISEWTWTGLLVLAGAAAPAAALTAVTIRLVGFAGLVTIMLVLLPIRLLRFLPIAQRRVAHG